MAISKKYKIIGLILLVLGVVTAAGIFLSGNNITILNPKGEVASKQKDLLITAVLLMLIVVIPVFVMTIVIAIKYRAGNHNAKYTPDWDSHKGAEFTWWAVPFVIIFILSVITWNSSHELDPFKPLKSDIRPITIQVVALQWKWLFIYPETGIASLNYVEFPTGTPVNFEITGDAPMNSFWIPSLGGQIYAMAGMTTQLHLIANENGSFNGSSANISGKGFSGMKFTARSVSNNDFEAWVQSARVSDNYLGTEEYTKLARPSENKPALYASFEPNLYDTIVMKYMMPHSVAQETSFDIHRN